MTSTISVLVLDDDMSVRKSLALLLMDYDFEVSTASNGNEGLKLIESHQPNVALVDMRVSDMNGETFILKAAELSNTTTFFIHTGSADYKLSSKLEKLGVQERHLFLKPVIDMDRFVEAIRNAAQEG